MFNSCGSQEVQDQVSKTFSVWQESKCLVTAIFLLCPHVIEKVTDVLGSLL